MMHRSDVEEVGRYVHFRLGVCDANRNYDINRLNNANFQVSELCWTKRKPIYCIYTGLPAFLEVSFTREMELFSKKKTCGK